MPANLIVAAEAFKSFAKGDIVSTPKNLPPGEVPIRFVYITISDVADRRTLRKYLSPWQLDFRVDILAENASGWRVQISVDPQTVSAQGLGNDIKAELRDHLQNGDRWAGATYVSHTASSVTIDLPKGGPWQDLQGMTDLQYLRALHFDLRELFGEIVSPRRYRFTAAAVDNANSQGGRVTVTRAQALANLIDLLDD